MHGRTTNSSNDRGLIRSAKGAAASILSRAVGMCACVRENEDEVEVCDGEAAAEASCAGGAKRARLEGPACALAPFSSPSFQARRGPLPLPSPPVSVPAPSRGAPLRGEPNSVLCLAALLRGNPCDCPSVCPASLWDEVGEEAGSLELLARPRQRSKWVLSSE